MKKTGYLTKKKVMGKNYIYIRRTFRDNGKIKNEYLYSFGAMPGALEKMYSIRNEPLSFPDKLSSYGFDLTDLYDWIMTLETKVTNTGRQFKV